jgi:hypothetical protein
MYPDDEDPTTEDVEIYDDEELPLLLDKWEDEGGRSQEWREYPEDEPTAF